MYLHNLRMSNKAAELKLLTKHGFMKMPLPEEFDETKICIDQQRKRKRKRVKTQNRPSNFIFVFCYLLCSTDMK